jgi:hypothetical protein
MQEQEQKRSKLLELYKNVNKLTMIGFLGFAAVAAFVAPALVIPALGLAAVDFGQMKVIDRINKKKQNPKEQVVFQASAA